MNNSSQEYCGIGTSQCATSWRETCPALWVAALVTGVQEPSHSTPLCTRSLAKCPPNRTARLREKRYITPGFRILCFNVSMFQLFKFVLMTFFYLYERLTCVHAHGSSIYCRSQYVLDTHTYSCAHPLSLGQLAQRYR